MLAEKRAQLRARHRLLAPTLLRSQVLAQLYAEVRQGALSRKEAAGREQPGSGCGARGAAFVARAAAGSFCAA